MTASAPRATRVRVPGNPHPRMFVVTVPAETRLRSGETRRTDVSAAFGGAGGTRKGPSRELLLRESGRNRRIPTLFQYPTPPRTSTASLQTYHRLSRLGMIAPTARAEALSFPETPRALAYSATPGTTPGFRCREGAQCFQKKKQLAPKFVIKKRTSAKKLHSHGRCKRYTYVTKYTP